jgi:hypothetical protein
MKLYKNILALTLMTSTAFAAQVPQSFTYQGRAFNQDGTVPITSSIDLTLGIYAPNGCLLYEETQTGIDLSHSDGKFSVQVGTAQGSGMRTSNDPGLSMSKLFANSGSQIRAAGAGCSSGYTPAAGDVRKLHVQIGVSGGAKVAISPDMVIASVPTAMVAETLQGKSPTDFVQLDGSVSQASMDSLTNGSEASALHNHDSLYLRKDAASITLPQASVTSVGSSNSAVTNKSYVDTAVSGVQSQVTTIQGKQSTDETAINANSTSIGSLQTSVSNNSSAITGLQSSVSSLNSSVSSLGSTYLTQSNAASTYLTQSSASSTYLTSSAASSTYATQASVAGATTSAATSIKGNATASSAPTADLSVNQARALVGISGEINSGNSGSSVTLNFANSPGNVVTMTANSTFNFAGMTAGSAYAVRIVQGGSGSYAVTWPSATKWPGGVAPTLSTAVGSIDLVSIYYDGTNYYASAGLKYQ